MKFNKIRSIFFLFLVVNFNILQSQKISYTPFENLTTSGRLPKNVIIQGSNNNLDLIFFKGKFYLAFRTAPTHFASKKTVLYVVSSSNRKHWDYETEFTFQSDIREPRFVVNSDSLLLYFFIGGKNMFKFEPKQVVMAKTFGNFKWSNTLNVGLDGYVPWRLRQKNDTLLLSAYYGKNLYNAKHRSDLRLFWSLSGNEWQVVSTEPQIDVPHAEEGEFIFDKTGCLFSVVRLESNGSLLCRGENCGLEKWFCKRSKFKYDSSLFFEHNNEIYLVSRRNLAGEMDRVKNRKNEKQGRSRNLLKYALTGKCTALFRLNRNELELEHILDFPSNGDNAFPAIAKIDSNKYLLMNYSSNINGRKKVWIGGQLGKTYIYETVLTFE